MCVCVTWPIFPSLNSVFCRRQVPGCICFGPSGSINLLVGLWATMEDSQNWEYWSRIRSLYPCVFIHCDLKGKTDPKSALLLWEAWYIRTTGSYLPVWVLHILQTQSRSCLQRRSSLEETWSSCSPHMPAKTAYSPHYTLTSGIVGKLPAQLDIWKNRKRREMRCLDVCYCRKVYEREFCRKTKAVTLTWYILVTCNRQS